MQSLYLLNLVYVLENPTLIVSYSPVYISPSFSSFHYLVCGSVFVH